MCHIFFYCQLPLLCGSGLIFYGKTSVVWLSEFKIPHTELRSLNHVFVHSTWREEQDVLDFAALFCRVTKLVAFWEFAVISSASHFSHRDCTRRNKPKICQFVNLQGIELHAYTNKLSCFPFSGKDRNKMFNPYLLNPEASAWSDKPDDYLFNAVYTHIS